MSRSSLLFVCLAWASILVSPSPCGADSSRYSENLGEEIQFVLYARRTCEPVLRVRVRRVYIDLRREGFFRIGFLKEVVAEGVVVEMLQRTADLSQLHRELPRAFAQRESSFFAVRNVTIYAADGKEVLHANSLRINGRREWKFRDGRVNLTGGEAIPFMTGLLNTQPMVSDMLIRNSEGSFRFGILSRSLTRCWNAAPLTHEQRITLKKTKP